MKKLIVQHKWKRHLAARGRYEAKARARFKEHRRDRLLATSKRTRHPEFKKTDVVRGPSVFSIIRNPEDTIALFIDMRASAHKRNVFVDLSEVTAMTPDAVIGLLATVHYCQRLGAGVSGNFPKNEAAKAMLNDSGFRDYVRSTPIKQSPAPRGHIVKRTSSGELFHNRFDQSLANRLIEFANLKLTGDPRVHGPSYSVFCEAMLNTFNHASKMGDSHELWWASVYFDSERNRVCFTFLDQGVGILRSYSIRTWLKLIAARMFVGKGEILKRLFQGQIPSSTKAPGRGNGIPEMYQHCKAGRIFGLTVVANDAIGSAEKETYEELSISFPGTLLYWEI